MTRPNSIWIPSFVFNMTEIQHQSKLFLTKNNIPESQFCLSLCLFRKKPLNEFGFRLMTWSIFIDLEKVFGTTDEFQW